MISAIVAVANNNIIGANGGLPWPHLKEDMQWFKQTTEHNIVVMGRTTWESLGKYAPLSNRINVVVSSKEIEGADKVITENILDEIKVLETDYPDKEIFIMGGAMLYESTVSILDRVYVTHIYNDFDGDTTINLDEMLWNTVMTNNRIIELRDYPFEMHINTYEKIPHD